jgi:hypothetical protein
MFALPITPTDILACAGETDGNIINNMTGISFFICLPKLISVTIVLLSISKMNIQQNLSFYAGTLWCYKFL